MSRIRHSFKVRVNWMVFLRIVGWLVVFAAVGCLAMLAVMRNDDNKRIPRMNIVLNDVSLETINENDKNIVYGGNELVLEDENETIKYDDVEIKGRGNYTWTDDKKPYQIRFSGKVDLMGMGMSRKWNLITNNLDDSLMRNDLAQYLAKIVDAEYVADGKFVRLWVGDEDLGVYYVTKKIAVGKEMVNLKNQEGVLVELDNNYCEYEDKKTVVNSGDCLVFKDFVNKDLSEEAMDIFESKYNYFEKMVAEGNLEAVGEVVDMESLAMYYLVSEFSANPDAYLSSFYFYLDGSDDKIHAGPMWDFDGAFGNLNWGNGELEDYAYDPWSDEYRIRQFEGFELYDENGEVKKVGADKRMSNVMGDLARSSEFAEIVKKIYNDKLRMKKEEVIAHIDEMSQLIKEDALSDAVKWEKHDFEEAVEYLKWWVEQRFWFFDWKFGSGGVMLKMKSIEI